MVPPRWLSRVFEQVTDWPIIFAQEMARDRWVIAQVALVGKVECPSPEPLRILYVGPYFVDHQAVRAGRKALNRLHQLDVEAYLMRTWPLIDVVDADGTERQRLVPPDMREDEAKAFRKLWKWLYDEGHVQRASTEELLSLIVD